MNKHSLSLLLVVSLLVGVIAVAWARSRGTTSTVQFSYQLTLPAVPEPAGAYTYDGYYQLQTTELVAKTVTAWLNAPEVAAAALRAAHQPVPTDTRQLAGEVAAQQMSPQLIAVTISSGSPAGARDIAAALQAHVTDYAARTHVFLEPTTSVTGTHGLRVALIGTATFVATFFIGLNALFLKRTFDEHRH